ncbi:uncharacterized protein [Rutidosis leptorrhynchoides]|uniref:uncharacterized protein isoform X1 n=1 Tax=Rutidosis leptorrhynchoides TaxID=125765 RepID=UPI003A994253
MLMDREVIRNEALLLLTYLTREAEEILKILVFEGAFEKFFSIIKEEGGSECGVVVQDCLELLNNLLRNNSSNQFTWKHNVKLFVKRYCGNGMLYFILDTVGYPCIMMVMVMVILILMLVVLLLVYKFICKVICHKI